jgi:uncharacterized protein YciI
LERSVIDPTESSFLVVNTPMPGAVVTANAIEQHRDFLDSLRLTGSVVLAGPFASGGGAYVVRVPDEAEALRIVRTDPLFPSCDFVVREWVLPASALTVAP